MFQAITSAVRHSIVSAITGYSAIGYITAEQANAFADAAVVAVTIVLAVVWSVVEKKYISNK